jgi:hypothetical protein
MKKVQILISFAMELSGFHDRDILYLGLLGCNAVRFGGRVPTFWKKILSLFSGLTAIAVLSVATYVPPFYRLDGRMS